MIHHQEREWYSFRGNLGQSVTLSLLPEQFCLAVLISLRSFSRPSASRFSPSTYNFNLTVAQAIVHAFWIFCLCSSEYSQQVHIIQMSSALFDEAVVDLVQFAMKQWVVSRSSYAHHSVWWGLISGGRPFDIWMYLRFLLTARKPFRVNGTCEPQCPLFYCQQLFSGSFSKMLDRNSIIRNNQARNSRYRPLSQLQNNTIRIDWELRIDLQVARRRCTTLNLASGSVNVILLSSAVTSDVHETESLSLVKQGIVDVRSVNQWRSQDGCLDLKVHTECVGCTLYPAISVSIFAAVSGPPTRWRGLRDRSVYEWGTTTIKHPLSTDPQPDATRSNASGTIFTTWGNRLSIIKFNLSDVRLDVNGSGIKTPNTGMIRMTHPAERYRLHIYI